METFAAEAPDVAAAFNRLIETLITTDGLDARTKQIAYIAIKAAQGDATAVAPTFRWPNDWEQVGPRCGMRSC
jgi:alkylhydroperoxidase/carboxymuconolactone decarboxylase family protein YurZ